MNATAFKLDEYPAIDVAYEHVGQSYELPQKRLDVIEGRIGALIGLTATITLGVLALSEPPIRQSWQLVAALALSLLVVSLGLWRLHSGALRVLNPSILRDGYLHLDPQEARYNLFYYSTQHFEHNMALVDRKARWLDILTALFILEAVLLAWWTLV